LLSGIFYIKNLGTINVRGSCPNFMLSIIGNHAYPPVILEGTGYTFFPDLAHTVPYVWIDRKGKSESHIPCK
jgi:hypothetical protein